MIKTYTNPVFDYRRSADQDADGATHHPVIIVGAGPAGLAAALDLALQGVRTVVLDDNDTVSVGSRAICFSQRTLEIMDRYGCSERMVDKGVTWQLGKVFFRDRLVYEFNLQPQPHFKMPAFINLQQYYFEQYVVERTQDFDLIDLRWKNKAGDVRADDEGASLSVSTPEGDYRLTCDYLLIADGANSRIRDSLGLESKGQVFQDKFLIADVVMKADFPTERWFWFDPPFHPDKSTLLHKQPDDVWRIDFQLGWDADVEQEKQPESVIPRIKAMLGDDVEFELEWTSVYTFRCRMMDSFIARRAFFIGDAATQVSPFGARGANGGVQGVENLAWKLARVLHGNAPERLLQTYDSERQHGAKENILNSTRATDFITPKNHVSRVFRDAALQLSEHYPFARALVNSGRLSMPCSYPDSPLSTLDVDDFPARSGPGSLCQDAPVREEDRDGWLLEYLGNGFICMLNADVSREREPALAATVSQLRAANEDLRVLLVYARQPPGETLASGVTLLHDTQGVVAEHYDLLPGNVYLIRPDQYVAARWRRADTGTVDAALQRALGFELEKRA